MKHLPEVPESNPRDDSETAPPGASSGSERLANEPTAPRRIVLYRNRRLYDSTLRSHITHRDLLKMIDNGVAFEIVTYEKVNCTHAMLLQLMCERATRQPHTAAPIITAEFLRDIILIEASSARSRTLLPAYLDHTIRNLPDITLPEE